MGTPHLLASGLAPVAPATGQLRRFPRLLLILLAMGSQAAEATETLDIRPGDRICIVGNSLAERLQYGGHWESLLHSRFPRHALVVRNLGWAGDAVGERTRPDGFGSHGHSLADHRPAVVIACFGFNESFAGAAGLDAFRDALAEWVESTRRETSASIVLCSPIAVEPTRDIQSGVAPTEREARLTSGLAERLALYAKAMAEVAGAHDVRYVDLLSPTRRLFASGGPWMVDGVHLNDEGEERVARLLDLALFGPRPDGAEPSAELRRRVQDKDRLFFHDYRAVNGLYIYGARREPFGAHDFPGEFAESRRLVEVCDQRIAAAAQGRPPGEIASEPPTAFPAPSPTAASARPIPSPEEALRQLLVADGFVVELFASEADFPELRNPVAIAFDSRGRLWVSTMPSYPQRTPRELLADDTGDRVLILEDRDGDGHADRRVVFADQLDLPMGIALGDGGCYVAQPPNLWRLRDTDGDDVSDRRDLLLQGFGTADAHHTISSFTWSPGGDLCFQEGTFLRSRVETPHGVVRCDNGGVYRWSPRRSRLDVWIAYSFVNPWGHIFDRWGQEFVADASTGAHWWAPPLTCHLPFPDKHPAARELLVKQFRPTGGVELVSSRNFPDDMQGDFLFNNVLTFQGVLRYRLEDDGAGFAAHPVDPLLRSKDTSFRPVDLRFGPDGALYVADWCNPLVGHLQHSLRDPGRDHTHGRIWRIRHRGRPLVKSKPLAEATVAELLETLRVPEDRTRERARLELRERGRADGRGPTLESLAAWTEGLTDSDPDRERLRLEALWVHQQLDDVDPALLSVLLRAREPRIRAAAVQVASDWRERLDDPLGACRAAVHDEHPRVRLVAVRALSEFAGTDQAEAARELCLESLQHPQDGHLEYTLRESLRALDN